MTRNDIRAMFSNGESPADCLRNAIAVGMEYPDAEWLVVSALRLDDEAKAEMIDNYDNQI
jgi:hypothetical protein